ncbi:MAG: hypothetical protein GX150_01345 [Firmicutes bacterium]|nr:hypothetical protein [Bacillota bacterium]
MLLLLANVCYAAPQVITGARRLLLDVLTWILVLIPIAGGAMVGYHSLLKILSDGDPAVVADRNRKIKTVLVGVVMGMSASGIVLAIVAYFV